MNSTEYLRTLRDKGLSKAECKEQYDEYCSLMEDANKTPWKYEAYSRAVRKVFQELEQDKSYKDITGKYDGEAQELIEHSAGLQKQKQAAQDKARIANKISRETNRVTNAIESLNRELIEIFSSEKRPKAKKTKQNKNGKYGIFPLSDLHFNELIHGHDLNNVYDFKIAGQRLKKYVDIATDYFNARGVTNVLVAGLGDWLNSDRRLDELLHMATNRARATFLSVSLVEQTIRDLQNHFNVSFAGVTGNESRAKEYNVFSDIQATDNYDYTIYNILKMILLDVNFYEGDWKEKIVDIGGFKLLMLHGEGIKTERNVRDIYSKYAHKGILIDYIIHGHYHSCMITDISARSASLCGANAYSDKELQLYGRASQNILIVNEDKSVDSIRIDLQNADCEGYSVDEKLEAYHAKSADKAKQHTTILEVKI